MKRLKGADNIFVMKKKNQIYILDLNKTEILSYGQVNWIQISNEDMIRYKTEILEAGVTPDFLDTVKGSRTPCTRLGSSCQVLSAERRDYNLQTILAIA